MLGLVVIGDMIVFGGVVEVVVYLYFIYSIFDMPEFGPYFRVGIPYVIMVWLVGLQEVYIYSLFVFVSSVLIIMFLAGYGALLRIGFARKI